MFVELRATMAAAFRRSLLKTKTMTGATKTKTTCGKTKQKKKSKKTKDRRSETDVNGVGKAGGASSRIIACTFPVSGEDQTKKYSCLVSTTDTLHRAKRRLQRSGQRKTCNSNESPWRRRRVSIAQIFGNEITSNPTPPRRMVLSNSDLCDVI